MSQHHAPRSSLLLPIRGMTCRSCELLLEESLGAVPGVASVRVRRSRGCAEIAIGDAHVDEAALERAVADAGYSVGHESLPWLSRSTAVYTHLLAGIAVVGLLWLVLTISGFDTPSLGTITTLSAGVALLVGLTAGISTCMALVGGIVLGVAAHHAQEHPHASRLQRFLPHLAFNGGRVVGFAILGAVLGAAGSVLAPSDRFVALLTLVVGVVMLLLGVKLTGVSPRLAAYSPTLPRWLAWKGPRAGRSSSLPRSAFLGMLTFFLPCGFTLAIQLAAIQTGSAIAGATLLGFFALGTVPGLLGIGGIASLVHGRAAKVFFAASGVLVMLLGGWNIHTAAITLAPETGVAAPVDRTPSSPDPSSVPNGPVEELRMEQNDFGYVPDALTVHAGSRVRWVITSTNPYTCASSLRVPALGISKQLVAGENIIEFNAPTTPGTIPFSCSMRMFTGSITVLPPA